MNTPLLPYRFTIQRLFTFDSIVTEHEIIIDIDDSIIVQKQPLWHMNSMYAATTIVDENHPNKNRKPMQLHRLIVNATDDMVVHHINGIRTDNRKENLMIMTAGDHIKLHAKQRRISKEAQDKMQAGRKKGGVNADTK